MSNDSVISLIYMNKNTQVYSKRRNSAKNMKNLKLNIRFMTANMIFIKQTADGFIWKLSAR